MSLLTTWGYTITDADALEDMISAESFNAITANKYAGDARIEPNIRAVGAAIRNYCGWHVYPEQQCSFSERLLNGNGHLKRTGTDILIQLPAAFVTGVTSVTIDGESSEDFDFETNGLVRVFDVYEHSVTRKTVITVEYTAGVSDAMMDAITELAAHRITHALASSAGVQSESSGGVSVTYSANWINSARSTALADDNKEVLAPYKVRGVF